MKCRLIILVLSLGLLQIKQSFATPFDFLINQARHSPVNETNLVSALRDESQEEIGEFNQILDHFSKNATPKKFRQRYFINSSLAQGPGSPVIFYICGEGTCEGASSTEFVNRLAKKFRAHRVALEHRYYGKSHPFKSLSTKSLRFLTMDQAIEDLATFQAAFMKNRKWTGPWIAVGGSYPGNLAAFYRLKHPELISGAIASSAPVYAKLDFFEYDAHVAKVIGSQCLKRVQQTSQLAEQLLLTQSGFNRLRQLFQVKELDSENDLLMLMADMAAVAVQYGSHEAFCKALENASSRDGLIEEYAKIGARLLSELGTTPFQASIAGALSTDPSDYMHFAGRPWWFQACTQFGYFQTRNANENRAARSLKLDLKYYADVCRRLFDIVKPPKTESTNKRYIGQIFKLNINKLIFTNGSNDPWSILSLNRSKSVESKNPNLDVALIPGASHCDDLGGGESAALLRVQDWVEKKVARWISETF